MNDLHASRRHDGERRPRVLLADDNALILEKASALLAKDFDLVAAVTDGRQALNASLQLDPDVAVLDISMAELDGLQTARELTRAGSRAKIVMLTMHDSDDYVAAAVGSGAQGYVLKTRMLADLAAPSIMQSPAGSSCPPDLALNITRAGAGVHALQVRLNDRAFWIS
jgi:DNA-binding NarL/FixJ family response regulator